MQHSEQTKVNISLVQSKLKKVQNSAASWRTDILIFQNIKELC